MYARLETTQLELIRLLEWLVIDPATYHDALSQANPLIRYFLRACPFDCLCESWLTARLQ